MISLSFNTQAILLLTASLVNQDEDANVVPIRSAEFRRLQNHLARINREPGDLIGEDADYLIEELKTTIEADRLRGLLNRELELHHAVERWQSQALWVVSIADGCYPKRFNERLCERAPLLIYGCGDIASTETNCFGVVGSRDVDQLLIEYTEGIGSLAARTGYTIVSGGARGVDQAGMRGAIDGGGKVVGILADSLERASVHRENRDLIMDERVLLLSVHEPSAGFSIANAMQRNKLIYALSDASLVVDSDYETGGTWAGAIEQLEKYHFGTLYVRDDATSKGLCALKLKGGLLWPEPTEPVEFLKLMNTNQTSIEPRQLSLL